MKTYEDSPIEQQWLEQVTWDSLSYYSRLRKVARFVQTHLSGYLDTRAAAKVACCEYKYFSAYFRQKVNISFTDWLRLVRVVESARLLQIEDVTIEEAGHRAGFRTTRALERAFRKFCGCTPAQFRNSVRPDKFNGRREYRRKIQVERPLIHEQ